MRSRMLLLVGAAFAAAAGSFAVQAIPATDVSLNLEPAGQLRDLAALMPEVQQFSPAAIVAPHAVHARWVIAPPPQAVTSAANGRLLNFLVFGIIAFLGIVWLVDDLLWRRQRQAGQVVELRSGDVAEFGPLGWKVRRGASKCAMPMERTRLEA